MSGDSAAPRAPSGRDATEGSRGRWSRWWPFGASSTYAAAGKRKLIRERHFIRRHWVLCSVVGLVTVAVGAAGSWALYLNNMLGDVDQFAVTVDDDKRPPPTHGDALNILVAGADNGPGPSISEAVETGEWDSGSHRSDTLMIVHIPEDRDSAYLVSIPRDSYVKIYDEQGDYVAKDKVNAAFSAYGPSGTLATVENLTGLRMDHQAIIDWKGFKDLSRALGGVEVYVPETFHDSSQNITWEQGTHQLQGEQALKYVRTRYGLDNGDFDRIARQQNFLRAMMTKLLSRGTVTNPLKLTSALRAITDNLTVDDDWSGSDMRNLALSLRDIRTEDVTFLTAPMARYDRTESGASVVVLDKKQCTALWKAMSDDDIAGYVDKYGEEAGKLPKPRAVE